MQNGATALTKEDVAIRWQITETTVENYEKNGILTRMSIPSVRFSLKQIEELEGVPFNPLSPLERKRLEAENERLKTENSFFKEIFRETISKTSKLVL